MEPDAEEHHRKRLLFARVEGMLGDRVAESHFTEDQKPVFTVFDLTDDDTRRIHALAAGLEVPFRVEAVDPADVSAWHALRRDLDRLRADPGSRISSNPGTDAAYERPPVRIALPSTAESTAAQLHERHGDFVAITVGALPYPLDRAPTRGELFRRQYPLELRTDTEIDPTVLSFTLDGPLSAPSGEDAHHGLLATNHTDEPMTVSRHRSFVVDPLTGNRVGGFSRRGGGPHRETAIEPGGTARLPLPVGTTSTVPSLGYRIPPGRWSVSTHVMYATLTPGQRVTRPERREGLVPPLDFEVLPAIVHADPS